MFQNENGWKKMKWKTKLIFATNWKIKKEEWMELFMKRNRCQREKKQVNNGLCVRASVCKCERASASVCKRVCGQREEGERERSACEEGKNWSYFAFFLPALPACSLHYKTRPSNILRAVYMHMCVCGCECECVWERKMERERGRERKGSRWEWDWEQIHPSKSLWESKSELIVECSKQKSVREMERLTDLFWSKTEKNSVGRKLETSVCC